MAALKNRSQKGCVYPASLYCIINSVIQVIPLQPMAGCCTLLSGLSIGNVKPLLCVMTCIIYCLETSPTNWDPLILNSSPNKNSLHFMSLTKDMNTRKEIFFSIFQILQQGTVRNTGGERGDFCLLARKLFPALRKL